MKVYSLSRVVKHIDFSRNFTILCWPLGLALVGEGESGILLRRSRQKNVDTLYLSNMKNCNNIRNLYINNNEQ